MTEAEIRNKIAYYRRRVNTNDSEIRKLLENIQKAADLRSNIRSKQDEFEGRLRAKRERMQLLNTCGINPRLTGKIYEMKKSILYSSEADNAYNSLSKAQDKITNEIDNMEQQIRSIKRDSVACNNQISYLNNLLRSGNFE